jgi:hypothetical protein
LDCSFEGFCSGGDISGVAKRKPQGLRRNRIVGTLLFNGLKRRNHVRAVPSLNLQHPGDQPLNCEVRLIRRNISKLRYQFVKTSSFDMKAADSFQCSAKRRSPFEQV